MNATQRRAFGAGMDFKILILILSVSCVLAYGHFHRVDKVHYGPRLELHDEIIASTAVSPYRYRVLVPLVGEIFTQLLSVVLPTPAAFLAAYALYGVLSIFFLLAMLFLWLRIWFGSKTALIGVLFVGGTLPIALQDHYFQPWSLLEAGLFSAALLAIHRQRHRLLILIVATAALNRETAIFIPVMFLLTLDVKTLLRWRGSKERETDSNPIVILLGMLLAWAVVYWGLRYSLGFTEHGLTIEQLLRRNTNMSSLSRTAMNGSLFLGGMWVFAALGLARAPSVIKRLALVIPAYMATIAIWGVWYEVRLLMPLYPILVTLGLFFVFGRDGHGESAESI